LHESAVPEAAWRSPPLSIPSEKIYSDYNPSFRGMQGRNHGKMLFVK
jgi:hypothetical protein